jgi:hypothetical protein
VVDLGTLRPGESAEATITLRNPTDETVVVERVETSCPCILATVPRLRLEPGGSVPLKLRFDPSKNLDFRGSLRINVQGVQQDRGLVFNTQVYTSVSDAIPESGHVEGTTSVGALTVGSSELLVQGLIANVQDSWRVACQLATG